MTGPDYDLKVSSFLQPSGGLKGSLGRVLSWEVLQRLGVGGMGAVYRAVEPASNRTAAVKFCFDQRVLFDREVDFLQSLHHASVIRYQQHGQLQHPASPEQLPYLFMEYVPGGSLAARLKHWGRLPLMETLLFCRDIADAIEHAHKQNIRHRDLKPDNVLLDDQLRAKLADFGLAVDRDTGDSSRLGTLTYMAPECFGNLAVIDKRAEYYSLGLIVHDCLTGVDPSSVGRPILRISADSIDLLSIRSEHGADVAGFVQDLCSVDPNHRLCDPAALTDRLNALLQQAMDQPVTVGTNWPQVEPVHTASLLELAEQSRPVLSGRLTRRVGSLIGKDEVLRQLRGHRLVSEELRHKVSLIVLLLEAALANPALQSQTGHQGEFRLQMKELERELLDFEAQCDQLYGQPTAAPLSTLPTEKALSSEFKDLLLLLSQAAILQKTVLITDNIDAAGLRAMLQELLAMWSLIDDYLWRVAERIRECNDQFLVMIEGLTRPTDFKAPNSPVA